MQVVTVCLLEELILQSGSTEVWLPVLQENLIFSFIILLDASCDGVFIGRADPSVWQYGSLAACSRENLIFSFIILLDASCDGVFIGGTDPSVWQYGSVAACSTGEPYLLISSVIYRTLHAGIIESITTLRKGQGNPIQVFMIYNP